VSATARRHKRKCGLSKAGLSWSTTKTALWNVLQEKQMIEGDLGMGYICIVASSIQIF